MLSFITPHRRGGRCYQDDTLAPLLHEWAQDRRGAEQAEGGEQKDQQAVAQEGKETPKMDKKEAARLLRSIDDKMAKYFMKPSPDETHKYKQKDKEKDW